MKEKIYSLEEYIKKINSYFEDSEEHNDKIDRYLYRGQADYSWPVKSSTCRFFSRNYPILDLTPSLMTDYVNRQKETIRKFTKENNAEYSLRHFGGDTPYIDFSRNCLVALYFACEELQGVKDGIVYLIEKGNVANIGEVVEINDGNNQAESRIRAQYACFVNPSKVEINKDILKKIFIDKDAKAKIIEQLEELQICRTTIYPDLMEYIRHQGQYTDVFKDEILNKIINLPESSYQEYPNVITSLLNLQNNKRITNNERKMIYCQLIKYYLNDKQPDKALEMLDEKALKENKIMEGDDRVGVSYKYGKETFFIIYSYMRGKCYLSKRMYKRALREFEEAIKDISKNENRELWKQKGLLDKIREIAREINNEMAYPMIKLDPRQLDKALKLLNYGNEMELQEKRGGLCYECGEYRKAIDEVKKLESDAAYNLRGRCYFEIHKAEGGCLEIARQCFNMAIDHTEEKNSLDHRYQLAVTYHDLDDNHYNDFDRAIEIYSKLSKNPFYSEDAMHKAAKYTHKKAKNGGSLNFKIMFEALTKYLDAIRGRKSENNATNFVDLAEVLWDIYLFEEKYPDREKETVSIKHDIQEELGKLTTFRESGQKEVHKLLNTVNTAKLTDKTNLLLMITYLLQIVVAIYPKDEYAYRQLGIVYEELWRNSDNVDYIDKALDAYNNSRYFYVKKGMYYKYEKVQSVLEELNVKIKFLIDIQLKNEK